MSHRFTSCRALFALCIGLFMLGSLSPLARAQFEADEKPLEERSNAELLDDFAFYVTIRNDELAASFARAILSRGLTSVEFVGVVEDSPDLMRKFRDAIRQAHIIANLEADAAKLERLYETGRLEKARNPDEIARNIALLTENPRARLLSRDRLMFAGEYAVPQLLEVLIARTNPSLEGRVERLLTEMGGDAVIPLCESLLGVDQATQERLCLILGQLQRRAAVPYLADVSHSTDASKVREAAIHAIGSIQGSLDSNVSVAELYWRLGERYYSEAPSLTRFPHESHQLLWTFNPGIGLYAKAIRTEVFHEARAMELAKRALKLDPHHEQALSLWLASNFSREIDQPQGYENPTYATTRRGASFYAILAGSEATQRVLARALEAQDTPLARRVIEALSQGAGGSSLWEGLGADKPLLDALTYPDRRVQYEAALALARAEPRTPFAGSDRVTPLLASAVRDASVRYAVVLARDPDRQQTLLTLLDEHGYKVLQSGASLDEVAPAIADAPGVDLIITDLSEASTLDLIDRVRSTAKLSVTPVLSVLNSAAWRELRPRFEHDALTDIRSAGVSVSQLGEAVDQLALRAVGPKVSPAEARGYASSALSVLRDLAIKGNPVFKVEDAGRSLIAALGATQSGIRLQVADVLAMIDDQRSQVALMDAALDASGFERVALLERVTDSAKAFGNLLEERQISRLTELTTTDFDEEAIAAAALAGALNLPGASIAPLILEDG